MTAPDIARLRALYEAATTDIRQLSGAMCEHGWDTHVCPLVGCGPDPENDAVAFLKEAPALLAAAERLARYEAAMGSEEARETVARAMCKQGGFDPDELMINDGWRWRYYVPGADAALAALARVVGE